LAFQPLGGRGKRGRPNFLKGGPKKKKVGRVSHVFFLTKEKNRGRGAQTDLKGEHPKKQFRRDPGMGNVNSEELIQDGFSKTKRMTQHRGKKVPTEKYLALTSKVLGLMSSNAQGRERLGMRGRV